MTINEAIKKAIEGGYSLPIGDGIRSNSIATVGTGKYGINPHVILFDPLFWQCLGKALGWSEEKDEYGIEGGYSSCCGCNTAERMEYPWLHNQHRLIDHRAAGGTIEEFFDQLS